MKPLELWAYYRYMTYVLRGNCLAFSCKIQLPLNEGEMDLPLLWMFGKVLTAAYHTTIRYSPCTLAGSVGYGSHFIVARSFPQQCWQGLWNHYVFIVNSFEQSYKLMQEPSEDQINLLQDRTCCALILMWDIVIVHTRPFTGIYKGPCKPISTFYNNLVRIAASYNTVSLFKIKADCLFTMSWPRAYPSMAIR